MTGVVAYILSKKYTQTAIKELGSVLNFKGVVDKYTDLPMSGNKQGDVWEVREKKAEYVWINDTTLPEGGYWELFGEIKSTNKAFPSNWHTQDTRSTFCQDILNDGTVLVGDCYFGGIAFKPSATEMPEGIVNGEAVVSIFQSTLGSNIKVIHVDMYSATTAPYTWSFNYYKDASNVEHITPWVAAVIDVQVDGVSVVENGVANLHIASEEIDVTLSEDLYTYAPIGVLTTEEGKPISQTNPKLVANEGESLKKVFDSILGTAVDTNPVINQDNTKIAKTGQSGTISAPGGEVGLAIAAQDSVITWTVNNTATCSYGLKTASADTYNKKSATTFNYPVKTRKITVGGTEYSYQLKITYPVLGTGCSVSVTTGTLVVNDTTNRVLYCNLSSSNTVAVTVGMPATSSTTSAITRVNTLSADVQFDNATYNGVAVDNFWTYLKNTYSTGLTPPTRAAVSSTAYTVTAGTYYPYYMQSNNATLTAPITGATKSTDADCYTNGKDHTIANTYFYFLVPAAKSNNKIQQYVTGQWNNMDTISDGTKNLTLSTNVEASYKVYRTAALVPSTLKLRITT